MKCKKCGFIATTVFLGLCAFVGCWVMDLLRAYVDADIVRSAILSNLCAIIYYNDEDPVTDLFVCGARRHGLLFDIALIAMWLFSILYLYESLGKSLVLWLLAMVPALICIALRGLWVDCCHKGDRGSCQT